MYLAVSNWSIITTYWLQGSAASVIHLIPLAVCQEMTSDLYTWSAAVDVTSSAQASSTSDSEVWARLANFSMVCRGIFPEAKTSTKLYLKHVDVLVKPRNELSDYI